MTRRAAAMLTSQDVENIRASVERGERLAVTIDGGLGLQAIAAIAAVPAGLARQVEAAAWVQRAIDRGLTNVCTMFTPNMTDDELDAQVELEMALRGVR